MLLHCQCCNAAEGSSRLSRGKGKKSHLLQTPLDKGIPQATTPMNTPMDVESAQFEDQQSLLQASSAVTRASVLSSTSLMSVVAPEPAAVIVSPVMGVTSTSGAAIVQALESADKSSPVQLVCGVMDGVQPA